MRKTDTSNFSRFIPKASTAVHATAISAALIPATYYINKLTMGNELFNTLNANNVFQSCLESDATECPTIALDSVSGFLPFTESGPIIAYRDFREAVKITSEMTLTGPQVSSEYCTYEGVAMAYAEDPSEHFSRASNPEFSCEPVSSQQAYNVLGYHSE